MTTNNTTGWSSQKMSRPTTGKTRIMNDAIGILEALKAKGHARKDREPVASAFGSRDLVHSRLITLGKRTLRVSFCMKPAGLASDDNFTVVDGIEYVRTLSSDLGGYTLSRVALSPLEKTEYNTAGEEIPAGTKAPHYINWIVVWDATPAEVAELEALGANAADIFVETPTAEDDSTF
jgi:hypothetical protein